MFCKHLVVVPFVNQRLNRFNDAFPEKADFIEAGAPSFDLEGEIE